MVLYAEPDPTEAATGIGGYLVPEAGIGGRLRVSFEDFVVQERSVLPKLDPDGDFVVARVTLRNWEANRFLTVAGKRLGISKRRIGFAGTKDKRAVTTQAMTFRMKPERLERLDLDDVEVEVLGRSKRALDLGDLHGNDFTVILREHAGGSGAPGDPLPPVAEAVQRCIAELGGFPNWFGIQRFGALRPITHEVGRLIVTGEIEQAVRYYLGYHSDKEGEEAQAFRRAIREGSDLDECLDLVPRNLYFERTLTYALRDHPDRPHKAIAALPFHLGMMFVHAYQSYLFNRMITLRLARGLPLHRAVPGDRVIGRTRLGQPDHDHPVAVGERNLEHVNRTLARGRGFVSHVLYGLESTVADGEPGEVEAQVIEEEQVERLDFFLPDLPRLSSKGSHREILAPVTDLTIDWDGAGGLRFDFGLVRGAYATCLLREVMQTDALAY